MIIASSRFTGTKSMRHLRGSGFDEPGPSDVKDLEDLDAVCKLRGCSWEILDLNIEIEAEPGPNKTS